MSFWKYVIFDLERFLPAYTEKYIKDEMDADEVMEKWIMVTNQRHIDQQEGLIEKFTTSGFVDQEALNKIKREDVPFPNIVQKPKQSWVSRADKRDIKAQPEEESPKADNPRKFDPKKAWEEAPEQDLNALKFLLGA